MEAGEETAAKVFAAVEEAFESDSAGAGAIVKEDGDGASLVEVDQVRMGGVDVGVWSVGPGIRGGCSGCDGDSETSHTGALDGGEDGELDAFLRHEVEHSAIDGGFGEPHAFGLMAEAGFEVGDAPADLSEGVATAGEGHDHVVVDLGDCG